MLGVAVAGAVSETAAVTLTPYITAFAAGLLIHVVSHDHSTAGVRTRAARVVDVLAVIAGVALVSQGGHAHGEYSGEMHDEVAMGVSHALLDLSLETAPALLLGLVLWPPRCSRWATASRSRSCRLVARSAKRCAGLWRVPRCPSARAVSCRWRTPCAAAARELPS